MLQSHINLIKITSRVIKMPRSRKKLAPAVLLLVSVFFLALLASTATMSAVMLANTPEDIVPTNVESISMVVRAPDVGGAPGQLLTPAPIVGAVGDRVNFTPGGAYSPVQAVVTDSWLSDQAGTFVASASVRPIADYRAYVYDASGNLVTYQTRYHYTLYMTAEVLFRTGPSNPIRYTPSSTFVSPCGEALWTYDSAVVYPLPSEYQGALTRYEFRSYEIPGSGWRSVYKTNTMTSPNWFYDIYPGIRATTVGINGPHAKVTTSVVPYTSWTEMEVNGPADALSAAAASRVRNIASAAPVHVDATVRVAGNTGRIGNQTSAFTYTLANGQSATVQMNTVQAIVGFGMQGGMQETGTYTGIVPNVNPPLHQFPDYDLNDPSFDSQHDPTPDVFTTGLQSAPDTGAGATTIEGSIHIDNVAPQVLLSGSAAVGPLGRPVVADINLGLIESNCNLPSTLDIDVSADIGAKLTANVATARLTYTIAGQAGDGSAWDVRPYGKYIQWPCGVMVDNYMAAMNVTFPVDIVSERSLQFVSGDGRPIDLSTIVDTDVNALFMDPRVDELYVTDTTPDMTKCTGNIFDANTWFGWIMCTVAANWASLWWIIVGLVVFVLFAALWLFGKVATFFKGIVKIFKRN
jgi:hypothetical protein